MATPYEFKPGPYSSHTLLLDSLPKLGAGARVLDVGCGDGYLGEILAERGYEVTGIERSDGFTGRFPESVRLVVADLEEGLPPLESRYDYVLCADILEHLRKPENLLAQIRGVLKRGGRLVASLPNSGNIYFRLNVLAGRFPQEDKGLFDRTHLRFYMWDGWARLLQEAGYSIETVRSSGIPVGLAISPGSPPSRPIEVLEGVSYELARLWKTLFAYQFIVTASTGRNGTDDGK